MPVHLALTLVSEDYLYAVIGPYIGTVFVIIGKYTSIK